MTNLELKMGQSPTSVAVSVEMSSFGLIGNSLNISNGWNFCRR